MSSMRWPSHLGALCTRQLCQKVPSSQQFCCLQYSNYWLPTRVLHTTVHKSWLISNPSLAFTALVHARLLLSCLIIQNIFTGLKRKHIKCTWTCKCDTHVHGIYISYLTIKERKFTWLSTGEQKDITRHCPSFLHLQAIFSSNIARVLHDIMKHFTLAYTFPRQLSSC